MGTICIFPEIYVTYENNKIPEFYVIFARKIFFHILSAFCVDASTQTLAEADD